MTFGDPREKPELPGPEVPRPEEPTPLPPGPEMPPSGPDEPGLPPPDPDPTPAADHDRSYRFFDHGMSETLPKWLTAPVPFPHRLGRRDLSKLFPRISS